MSTQISPMSLKDANVISNLEPNDVKLGKRDRDQGNENEIHGGIPVLSHTVVGSYKTQNSNVGGVQSGDSTSNQVFKKQKVVKTKEEREQERLEKEKEREAKLLLEEERKAERLAEKQKKDAEREEKKRQKEEEKRQREEEKRQREEEKRQRDALKEEEKRKKEEEKRQKEEEKQKAKLKEEKKQLRMDDFFKTGKIRKPKEAVSTRSSSVELSESKSKSNSFDENFLPFHVKVDMKVYPRNVWVGCNGSTSTLISSSCMEFLKSHKVKRGYNPKKTTTEIVQLNNISSLNESNLETLLKSLPRRHIKFTENIRPPYEGTFSKVVTRKMAICSCERSIPNINYDYDSDGEWINEDEGEEIGDDDDESDESEEDEDLEGFVEDESNEGNRRMISALAPLVKFNDGNEPEIFNNMKIEILVGDEEEGIDPFKDYWSVSKVTNSITPASAGAGGAFAGFINGTSNTITSNTSNTITTTATTATTTSTASATATAPTAAVPKLFPENQLKEFLLKVQGSDKNQTLLIETLRIEFQVPKTIIRDTIKACAKRIGNRENDKRWIINNEIAEKYQIPSYI